MAVILKAISLANCNLVLWDVFLINKPFNPLRYKYSVWWVYIRLYIMLHKVKAAFQAYASNIRITVSCNLKPFVEASRLA